jgi:tRNA modification GTPase
MISDDTIVAISSAVGPAARMIVRMSGPDAFRIAANFQEATTSPEDRATGQERVRFQLNGLTFPATTYSFCAPHSATGEDVLELHLPGNPLLARMVLDAAIAAGARSAEPGEFTARSYFNARLDLSAAEGVGAVIAAQNQRELDGARRLLAGELSRRLWTPMDLLAQTLALVEADIDFAGEEISILSIGQIRKRVGRIDDELAKLLNESARFESLSHEPRIVLTGRPNAGKSTLLNVLATIDRAIVSSTAGTTRDVLSASVRLGRGMVVLMDAAGLDDAGPCDAVSEQMHAASLRAVESADVVVLVREGGDQRPEIRLPVDPQLRVCSKIDLAEIRAVGIGVSARTGIGLQELRDRLDELAFGPAAGNTTLAINARHVRCIEEARTALARAVLPEGAELIALELREALDSLGGVLGSVTPDDVLGRVFSTFCIGK